MHIMREKRWPDILGSSHINPSLPEGINTTIPDGYSLQYSNDFEHSGWDLIGGPNNTSVAHLENR